VSTLLSRLACAALLASPAAAHDGPPYPIFVDEAVGDWTLSVWADPDVGTGTFYYYVTAPAGHAADELTVEAIAVPADATTAEVTGESVRAEPGEPFQLIGTLAFDHRGTWHTRFVVRAGGALRGELACDLAVTPPGLGTFDLLWFSFPFLVIGGLWLRVLLAQRAHDRANAPSHSTTP
jgi:hypothetical protein